LTIEDTTHPASLPEHDVVTSELERALRVRRGDALLRMIAGSASELVATLDLALVVREISPACSSMFGYEPAAMIGRPMVSFAHAADRTRLERSFADPAQPRVTYRQLKKDGSYLWVEATSSVVRDPIDGSPREIVSIVRNIHERKRAEDRFRVFVEGSPEASVVVDRVGNIVLVNARVERLFGYGRSALIGRPFDVLIAEHAQGQRFALQFERSIGSIELLARRHDGSEFPAEISVNRLETEGELLFSTTILDITDRKSLQDQQMLLRLGEELPRFEDVPSLVEHIATELGKYFDVERCSFTENDYVRGMFILHAEFNRSGPNHRGVYPLSAFTPSVRHELELGRVVAIADAQNDHRTIDVYETRYQPIGMRALVSVPLLRDGHWVASFFMGANSVRYWTTREIQMLQALTERTWLWIEHTRMVRALRDSERKYRHFIESTHEGVWEIDAEARTRFVNPRMSSGARRASRSRTTSSFYARMARPGGHGSRPAR
jgi:PAS domain S-box-containing protein